MATTANVPSSSSGVTIGAGVDLHAQTASGLAADGVPQSIIDSLAPYMNPSLTGSAATAALTANGGLSLSASDAQTLTTDVMNNYIARTEAVFNAHSQVQTFSELPADTQTAIVDLAFQYNPESLPSRAPSFFNDIATGNWIQGANELDDFGDAFPSRRQAESGLLNNDMTDHAIPLDSTLGQCSK